MNNIISRIFKRKGISGFDELDNTPMPDGSPSERQVFEQWQAVLSKDELTVADIKNFCISQIGVIEGKWQDLSVRQEVKAEYIPYHTVYRTLLSAIDSPKVARENLEKTLINLTK